MQGMELFYLRRTIDFPMTIFTIDITHHNREGGGNGFGQSNGFCNGNGKEIGNDSTTIPNPSWDWNQHKGGKETFACVVCAPSFSSPLPKMQSACQRAHWFVRCQLFSR